MIHVGAGSWNSRTQWNRVDPTGIHGTQGTLKVGPAVRIFCGCNQMTNRINRKAKKATTVIMTVKVLKLPIQHIAVEMMIIKILANIRSVFIRKDDLAPFSSRNGFL